MDNKEAKDLSEFFKLLLGDKKKKMAVISSYVNGRVMSAGENFRPFEVLDSANIKLLDSAFAIHDVRFEICYCSIYKECWLSKGVEVVESDCP